MPPSFHPLAPSPKGLFAVTSIFSSSNPLAKPHPRIIFKDQ